MTQTHFLGIYDPRTSKSVVWKFAMKMREHIPQFGLRKQQQTTTTKTALGQRSEILGENFSKRFEPLGDLIIFQRLKMLLCLWKRLCGLCGYADKLDIKMLLINEDPGSILGRCLEHWQQQWEAMRGNEYFSFRCGKMQK